MQKLHTFNTETPKEDMILEDLICTDIMQRGVGNVNSMKMAKCIMELDKAVQMKKVNDDLVNAFLIISTIFSIKPFCIILTIISTLYGKIKITTFTIISFYLIEIV